MSEDYDDWIPTPDFVNDLPEPIRRYIHELEAQADPAGMCAENVLLNDQYKAVVKDHERIRDALVELVELKRIKDEDGKTDDYKRRQPAAWAAARDALGMDKEQA